MGYVHGRYIYIDNTSHIYIDITPNSPYLFLFDLG